jgi:hypothetical protein
MARVSRITVELKTDFPENYLGRSGEYTSVKSMSLLGYYTVGRQVTSPTLTSYCVA